MRPSDSRRAGEPRARRTASRRRPRTSLRLGVLVVTLACAVACGSSDGPATGRYDFRHVTSSAEAVGEGPSPGNARPSAGGASPGGVTPSGGAASGNAGGSDGNRSLGAGSTSNGGGAGPSASAPPSGASPGGSPFGLPDLAKLFGGSGTGAGGAATPLPAASPAPGSASAASICVQNVNNYRGTLGLAPLSEWTDSETCAGNQAGADSRAGTAHSAFGSCGENAQNECPAWPAPAEGMIANCLKAMWAEGPGGGHYENMRGPYTQVACGFTTAADGTIWAVQDFR